ncbi:hypothetical protein LXA43DRAFT_99031 [Ganoderma leucocontextum]|nr:hypothetical protein LXA43DRAFT_99031 [Ganoderma leucocontextum]
MARVFWQVIWAQHPPSTCTPGPVSCPPPLSPPITFSITSPAITPRLQYTAKRVSGGWHISPLHPQKLSRSSLNSRSRLRLIYTTPRYRFYALSWRRLYLISGDMSQLRQSTTPDKPLPVIPQPFKPILSLSPGAEAEDEDEVTALLPSADSSDQVCAAATSDTTKREYALLELLDSERTYASDLILIRDYQIPLASGRLSSISSVWLASDSENTIRRYPGLGPPTSDTPATLPGSCAVASRPLTTASDVSALSLDSIFTLRPMKTKDVNIVFGNIEELAAFSERFLDQLESALGKLIEDSDGEDYVGRFFLDFIPQMEPLYRTYIMNQTHALEHYHRLSETFQFDVYFPRSQILAHKSSNAWDLPSLLIKPVQRLLNYPQLLAAIIAETPDSHHDKANLIVAHAQIGALARDLNARWRQQKVVREVLASTGVIDTLQTGGDAANAKKKGGLAVGLAASVGGLGRVMNLRSAAPKANAEAERAVMAMGERLKSYEPFMMQFTREAVDWADAMLAMVGALDEWAQSFGRMIWMDPDEEHSDMFKAFLALIRDQLLPLCGGLEVVIKEDLFRTVASLMKTMVAPMCLLEAMETLEPLHYSSVGRNVEASESYMALRAQLFADLPTYFTLLDKGIAACILKFAHIQRTFYSTVRDRWAQLWDGVRVEVDGEANQGAAETFRAWWNRFTDVDEQLTRLSIARRLGEKPTTVKRRTEPGERYTNGEQATSSAGLASILAAIEQSRAPPRQAIRPPYYSPPPFGHPAFTGTRPGSVHSMYWTEREDRHSSLSDTMQEDGPGQWSRRPSSSQRLTDSPSPNLYKFTKIETSDSIGDVIQPREDVISMEEVAKSRRRVQFDVQPRIIPMPTDSDDDDGEEAATDSDDTSRNMAFSYWGADKVMLQKPIVKPKAPLASSSRRAVTPMTAYARESAVNAKFGTRLVHVAPRRAPRPRQGVISMEESTL